MVYPGKLSSGCGLCRKRKVKCDETQPSCRRCELYGSECPGYQRPLVVRFPKEPRRGKWSSSRPESLARANEAHLKTLASTSEQSAEDSTFTSNLPAARQPQPSWEEESLMFFLHDNFVAPLPGFSSGHLDFLPELYSSCCQTSSLKPATLAAAYLSLSRHYKSRMLYLEARKYYGQALRSVNTSLSNPKHERQDVTLSAIMLLSLIEDIDGEVPGVKALHLWGISRLFEAQGHRLLCDIQRGSLFRWIFTQLTIYAFTTNQSLQCLSLPELSGVELEDLHPSYRTTLIVAKISNFYSTTAKKLAGWAKSPTTSAENRTLILSTMHQAMLLQDELSSWDNSIPEPLRPRFITVENNRPLIIYSSRWFASVWSLYSSSLILFYSQVLSCCKTMLDHDCCKTPSEMNLVSTAAELSEKSILRLIETICGSIPYSFGKVDEYGNRVLSSDRHKASVLYNLIWPLALVSRCRFSTEDQIQLCGDSLKHIASMYGLNLAYVAGDLVTESLGDLL